MELQKTISVSKTQKNGYPVTAQVTYFYDEQIGHEHKIVVKRSGTMHLVLVAYENSYRYQGRIVHGLNIEPYWFKAGDLPKSNEVKVVELLIGAKAA